MKWGGIFFIDNLALEANSLPINRTGHLYKIPGAGKECLLTNLSVMRYLTHLVDFFWSDTAIMQRI